MSGIPIRKDQPDAPFPSREEIMGLLQRHNAEHKAPWTAMLRTTRSEWKLYVVEGDEAGPNWPTTGHLSEWISLPGKGKGKVQQAARELVRTCKASRFI